MAAQAGLAAQSLRRPKQAPQRNTRTSSRSPTRLSLTPAVQRCGMACADVESAVRPTAAPDDSTQTAPGGLCSRSSGGPPTG